MTYRCRIAAQDASGHVIYMSYLGAIKNVPAGWVVVRRDPCRRRS
jgi:hypothetical protein